MKAQLSKCDTGEIVIELDGVQIGHVRDGATIIRRVDAKLAEAGYCRTTGYWPDSKHLRLEAEVTKLPGAGMAIGL